MQDEQAPDIDLGGEEEPSTAPDPFAETAPDPNASLGGDDGEPAPAIEDVSDAPEEERLGGEGAELDEAAPPPQVSELGAEEPVAEEPAAPEPEPEPEPAAEPEPEPAAEPEPEPEPAAEEPKAEEKPKEKPKKKPKAKKSASPERTYKILVLDEDGQHWEIPAALKEGIESKNTEQALREAYNTLSPEADESMTLVAVPGHYWKPRPVKAVPKESRAIQVG